MINFLALFGWSPGNDQEIFSREELVAQFDLGGITKHPAVFDLDKLSWLNGMHIRLLTPTEFARRALPFLQAAGLIPEKLDEVTHHHVERAVALEQERVRTLAELPAATEFFFREEPVYDDKAVRKWLAREDTPPLLRAAAAALQGVEDWSEPHLEAALRALAEGQGVNASEIIHRVRAATTGRTTGPGLFETLAVLGRDRVLRRLETAAAREW